MDSVPDWVRHVLTLPRFVPYLRSTDGDVAAAIRLYWWNVDVSAAFYPPLHLLELALRNSAHAQLGRMFQRADWWSMAPLDDNGLRQVRRAESNAAGRRPHDEDRTDDVVTELSFGFWVSLLSRQYDRHLWVPGLYRAFPGYQGKRRDLHERIRTMMLFRNRIMHYEPIHHRHLWADRTTIISLLGYISADALECLAAHDRIPDILRNRPSGGRDELD